MSIGGGQRSRDALVIPVAVVVLGGWVVSLVGAVLTGEYAPLTAVTPVMLLLAGFVFGTNIVKSATRGRDDE